MSEFEPVVWPEEAAPTHAVNCTLCELSNQRTRVIWGEGNPSAPIIVILDNPGAREDAAGHAFVCGTRQTLQRAAHDAGLSADDLYVTYLLKCRPVRVYNKTAARKACLTHLNEQLAVKRPRIAFCLGNVAVQSFFGDDDADVKTLRNTWHHVRNMDVAVSYHPLAVRRRPNLHSIFMRDWRMVAEKYNALQDSGEPSEDRLSIEK